MRGGQKECSRSNWKHKMEGIMGMYMRRVSICISGQTLQGSVQTCSSERSKVDPRSTKVVAHAVSSCDLQMCTRNLTHSESFWKTSSTPPCCAVRLVKSCLLLHATGRTDVAMVGRIESSAKVWRLTMVEMCDMWRFLVGATATVLKSDTSRESMEARSERQPRHSRAIKCSAIERVWRIG